MSIAGVESRDRESGVWLARRVLPVYAATIFTSALLLFSVEPMFTKMALPALGGSPSVWSIAMVFFQTLMFAGYCYAHVLTRWLAPRHGALAHGAMLALALLSLPVALRAGGSPPDEGNPAFWLIGVFAMSVGLPFFVLSAQGPLLQAWFALSGHRHARDPYFLYGASNIGSFVALLAYPLAMEPLVGLAAQSRAWTAGFVLLAAMMTACGLCVFGGREVVAPPRGETGRTAVSAKALLGWIALAFVPSALLVSVTAHVSTDIAAAPLLWVAPLGLYLLTFVLAFRPRAEGSESRFGAAQAWIGAAVLMAGCIGMFSAVLLSLVIHLALFFVNAMVCHGALYRARPAARDLTVFYAAMSLGGALGGLFAGLAAPLMFSSVVEYPLLISAALFCRPGAVGDLRALTRADCRKLAATAIALPLLAFALTALARLEPGHFIVAAGIGAAILLEWRGAGRVAVLGVSASLCIFIIQGFASNRETFRSFFGVHRIEETRNGQFRTLGHGTTLHGAIRIREKDGSPVAGRPEPTTYYTMDGPLGEAIAAARGASGHLGHAAFIGLGAGALACHVRPDEQATFYEIDPLVIRIARDSGRFRYIGECAPQLKFVPGDARLTLARQPESSDIVVVDAFSSDAIPLHLLTREAFELYLSKLTPDGLIAVHISNNTMEFQGVIARVAADLGLTVLVRRDTVIDPEKEDFRSPSVVAILARDPARLGALAGEKGRWKRVAPDMASWSWTDDYSTILKAISAKPGL